MPQFVTTIDGLGIHLLHVRSPHPGAHATCSSRTAGRARSSSSSRCSDRCCDPAAHGGDPADAFHVVCPSLPGYGFSDKPAAPGWGIERIASAWAELMTRLGYERFGAAG